MLVLREQGRLSLKEAFGYSGGDAMVELEVREACLLGLRAEEVEHEVKEVFGYSGSPAAEHE